MLTPLAEKAIFDAQTHGNAILKFISANDTGVTGSHQAGFYLPKGAWNLYAPFGPVQGRNDKSQVKITWQGGAYETNSVVTWYGKGDPKRPRSEYRLTSFGRGFPYLQPDMVGDLLVLIPIDVTNFLAYIIDLPEDIEEILVTLGIELIGTWGVYRRDAEPPPLSEDDCLDIAFRKFAEGLEAFPEGIKFSTATREALLGCVRDFAKKPADDRLLQLMQGEYRLFKLVERQICHSEVVRLFKDIDDFLKTAATIMNRRKSRAGRSMEQHVQYLLAEAKIPFDACPDIEGEPDIVIPSKVAYDDNNFPINKLFMLGIKTTCKDRWRQVTLEAPRIPVKHLMTIQEGVTAKQLIQMKQAKVSLIVPDKLHSRYPEVEGFELLNIEGFIKNVRKTLSK